MRKALSLEFYKLRRKYVLPMALLFLTVELVWAFIAVSMSFERNRDSAGWEVIVAMLSTMNGLFLPLLSAIVVSRICDMEHKGNTWRLLRSMAVQPGKLYAAKYACAGLIMLGVCLCQLLAIAVFGVQSGYLTSVPLVLLARFLFGTLVTTLVVLALQQWISTVVKNQAFALCLGMLGGFLGMVGDLFPEAARRVFVWAYYTGLSPVTQQYASEKMQFVVREAGPISSAAAVLLAVAALLFLMGRRHASRLEG
ncbi:MULTISPECIES: ABC transporter permease [Brevibacillus]|uniref:ABC transporter permease n=1 Tax=Brevibacillus TaxID=55080 RepID=UPI00156B4797|nr:ABC transporter permease [Brevibacillus sp. HD3.3A]MBU8715889.1 ABC transporter permease [Brevibacillus parabrevis]NRQ55977.1 ABC transporter permease [Brevibacillus sp. HD1.4A]UED68555.1 ABC transporter permease [Brevibacillus sp. HD3.3A]